MWPPLDFLGFKRRDTFLNFSKRRPDSVVTSASLRWSTESRRDSGEAHGPATPKSPPHRMSLNNAPPDLSDSKWHAYVHATGGSPCPLKKAEQLELAKSPAPSGPIPEFAHLAVATARKVTVQSSNPTVEAPPSPQATLSPSPSIKRRYAKTPVLRIGQLEGEPALDAESIAEQYRALLDARSFDNLQSTAALGTSPKERRAARPSPLIIDSVHTTMTPERPSPPTSALPQAHNRQLSLMVADTDLDGASPTSDGTLVDLEEDLIFFKPAFSSKALPPIPEDDDDASSLSSSSLPWPQAEASSLQIAMEMLNKELARTLRRNQPRTRSGGATVSAEVPTLQTWLMIEAYEKLRDQVLDMQLPVDQAHALQDMFDMWLRALNRVHRALAHERHQADRICASSEPSLQTMALD